MNVLLVDYPEAVAGFIAIAGDETSPGDSFGETPAVAAVQRRQYELVLLDWWLGSRDAEHCFGRLRDVAPAARIVVIVGRRQRVDCVSRVGNRRRGFFPKAVLATDELIVASQLIASGGIYVPGHLPSIPAHGVRPAGVTH